MSMREDPVQVSAIKSTCLRCFPFLSPPKAASSKFHDYIQLIFLIRCSLIELGAGKSPTAQTPIVVDDIGALQWCEEHSVKDQQKGQTQ